MKTKEEFIQGFAEVVKKEYNIEDDELALKIGLAIVEVIDSLVEEIKKS